MIILKEYPAVGSFDLIFLLAIGMIALLSIAIWIILYFKDRRLSDFFFPAAMVAGFIFASLLISTSIRASHTRYDLFVSDDSIPFDKFCSKWRIINIDGDTITAERKEPFLHCFECDTDILNDWSIYCPECGRRIER